MSPSKLDQSSSQSNRLLFCVGEDKGTQQTLSRMSGFADDEDEYGEGDRKEKISTKGIESHVVSPSATFLIFLVNLEH